MAHLNGLMFGFRAPDFRVPKVSQSDCRAPLAELMHYIPTNSSHTAHPGNAVNPARSTRGRGLPFVSGQVPRARVAGQSAKGAPSSGLILPAPPRFTLKTINPHSQFRRLFPSHPSVSWAPATRYSPKPAQMPLPPTHYIQQGPGPMIMAAPPIQSPKTTVGHSSHFMGPPTVKTKSGGTSPKKSPRPPLTKHGKKSHKKSQKPHKRPGKTPSKKPGKTASKKPRHHTHTNENGNKRTKKHKRRVASTSTSTSIKRKKRNAGAGDEDTEMQLAEQANEPPEVPSAELRAANSPDAEPLADDEENPPDAWEAPSVMPFAENDDEDGPGPKETDTPKKETADEQPEDAEDAEDANGPGPAAKVKVVEVDQTYGILDALTGRALVQVPITIPTEDAQQEKLFQGLVMRGGAAHGNVGALSVAGIVKIRTHTQTGGGDHMEIIGFPYDVPIQERNEFNVSFEYNPKDSSEPLTADLLKRIDKLRKNHLKGNLQKGTRIGKFELGMQLAAGLEMQQQLVQIQIDANKFAVCPTIQKQNQNPSHKIVPIEELNTEHASSIVAIVITKGTIVAAFTRNLNMLVLIEPVPLTKLNLKAPELILLYASEQTKPLMRSGNTAVSHVTTAVFESLLQS